MAEPCLAETTTGPLAVLGAWRPGLLDELSDFLSATRHSADIVETAGMKMRLISGPPTAALEHWAEQHGVTMVPDAARAMGAALPPLGEVGAALARMQMPAFRQADGSIRSRLRGCRCRMHRCPGVVPTDQWLPDS